MTPLEAVLGALVMVVGAAVQGAVGFGSNLIAAPLLVLIDPRFVPVPTIVASLTLNVLVANRERAPVVMRELRFALGGFVPGAVLGAALLAVLDERTLGLAFAGFVLLAVALTASGIHLRPTPGALLGAGFLSGAMGTASSIGGPPMAMLHSRSEGPVIRATLARFFLAAGVISFAGLTLFGEVGWDDLRSAAVLFPGSLVGFAISGRGATWLDRGYTRPAILFLCFGSAVAVAVKYLL